MQRLARLANIRTANPEVVNSKLNLADKGNYYQVLHDYVDVIALDLADISEGARTAPFQIETFGPPAHRAPIRCSPPH